MDYKAKKAAKEKELALKPKKSPKEVDLSARRVDEPTPPQTGVPSSLDGPSNHHVYKPSSTRMLDNIPLGALPDNVRKQIVYSGISGRANPPYPKGSRLRLHFKAISLIDGSVLDDSKDYPKPMEFLVGKKFKMEVWESALNTMFVGEVAKFLVPKELTFFYPMVAKVLRNSFKPRGEQSSSSSCCAHNMLSGTGYEDLDKLLKQPANMAFTFELLEVSLPGEFEMESWYMTDEQKAESISDLQDQGNKLYYERHYKDASTKYLEAISRIEQLMNKESPGSPEMDELRKKKVPLLLNHGLCRQQNREFYEAIKYNNNALEIEPENVKGIFRRGQCFKETGHWKEARADLKLALKLDATLQRSVKFELECVNTSEEVETAMERARCQRMLQQKGDGEAAKLQEEEGSLEKQKRLVTELLEKTRLEDEAKEAEAGKLDSEYKQPALEVVKEEESKELLATASNEQQEPAANQPRPRASDEPPQLTSNEPEQSEADEPPILALN